MEGVKVARLQQFHDDLGAVYHMIRTSDDGFVGFGEIYFSIIAPRKTKAWKRHRDKTSNIACVVGDIQLVLYDDRPESATRKSTLSLDIGEGNYHRVTIPPRIWFGFRNPNSFRAVLANCANLEFDPSEGETLPPDAPEIPYQWELG